MPDFQVTAVGTGSGATATQAAITNTTFVATSISGHTDTDAVITIESPAGTVLWQQALDVTAEGFKFGESGLHIRGADRAAIVGKISASTTDAQVNINGYNEVRTFARGEVAPQDRGHS